MKRRNGIGSFGRILLVTASLLFGVGSLAQEDEREVPLDDDRAEYADLEEVIVRGRTDKWRVTDEDIEKMWREVEGDPPPPEGAVADFGGARFKAELLPVYDPEDPLLIDLGSSDQQRMEAVELFRVRF